MSEPGGTARPRRVVVVGAGASGTMAAIAAAAAGAQTILLERTDDGGRKILASGGGRCNLLPVQVDPARFVTDSSANTLRRIVRSWPLAEQRSFFENEVGIPLVEEVSTGKIFPASHRARDVRDGLLALAKRNHARVQTSSRVLDVSPSMEGWRVVLADAPPLEADAVALACGGLSAPSTGSDGTGLEVARRLGHTIHPTYPALTPLLAEEPAFAPLAGVSLTVTLTARAGDRAAVATGGFLFTHGGYSGPAVLDVSHVVARSRAGGQAGARVHVKWTALDDRQWEAALRPHGARTVTGALRAEMPDRLASALLEIARVDPRRSLADLRRDERLRLVETLVRGALPWRTDAGYEKAEVTGGGVSLDEVDPRRLESRRHPGLHMCGEMLDAFGPIGGYNFLWAWTTGRAAGLGAAAAD